MVCPHVFNAELYGLADVLEGLGEFDVRLVRSGVREQLVQDDAESPEIRARVHLFAAARRSGRLSTAQARLTPAINRWAPWAAA